MNTPCTPRDQLKPGLMLNAVMLTAALLMALPLYAQSASSAAGPSGPSTLYGLKPASGELPVYTLEQSMKLAAERNYDLRIAAEQITQAQTVIRRAWSAVLPRLTANGQYMYTTPVTEISFMDQDAVDGQKMQLESQALMLRTMGQLTAVSDPEGSEQLIQSANQLESAARDLEPSDPIAIQPAHLFTGNVQLQIPIFNARTIPLVQNSYDMVGQARLSLDRARQQALFGVASAYFAAITVKKMIGITENALASSQSHRDATEARVAAGAVPAIALKRAEYDVIQAEQSVRSTRSTYSLLLGTLGMMMGVDSQFDIVEPREVVEVELQGDNDRFYQRALASRLDLKALKLSLNIAERGMVDYWMHYLPSLNLIGQANWTSNTGGFQTDPLSYNVVLAASIPLYDGGARYAVRDEAASKIRQAHLTLDKTEDQIAGMIRGNLQDISVRQEGLQASRVAVELARENHSNAVILFEVGAATNLEVLDATSAELGAEMALARAELDLRMARLGLLFVVGEYPPVESGTGGGENEGEAPRSDGAVFVEGQPDRGVPASAPATPSEAP